jgi:hypothetical protein
MTPTHLQSSLGQLSVRSATGWRDFPIERQLMSNWCWAASTLSLCRFYSDLNVPGQRQFVASLLHIPACAAPVSRPACNQTFNLGDAIRQAGHLHGDPVDGPLLPQNLVHVLSSFGPVSCQMDIPGIGGHAVVIVDAKTDEGQNVFLRVADPADGSMLITTFRDFRNNYRGTNGRWIRSYMTSAKTI